jgi:hypothetical protein
MTQLCIPHARDLIRGGDRCDMCAQDDEIERLRKALENERARGIHTCHDQCGRPLCVAQRENDRLRSLLREARSNVTRLLIVLRDASLHIPPKAPIDMKEANAVTSDLIDWIGRIDAAAEIERLLHDPHGLRLCAVVGAGCFFDRPKEAHK